MSNRFASFCAAAVLGAVGVFSMPAPAYAGDVSQAQLGCYVDTYAYDQLELGGCYGGWTPYTADNPSVAVFEVVGLPAGSYSFSWIDRDTGQTLCVGSVQCWAPIGLNQSVRLTAFVWDTQTGALKKISADAMYFDAWN